jgi:crotonobetainyl-CoA:carnitine CoA-transferase CaiB-like acyl-CoA transferase
VANQPFPSLRRARILDLTDRWGQYAAKLLTQLGADVVMAEPPEGHPLRAAWPLAVLDGGESVSVYFWHFNLGKRSATFDMATEDGRLQAATLVRLADVVLIGEERYRALGAELSGVFQDTHVVIISPYGLGGSDPDGSDDLHVAARSGMAGLSGYGTDDDSAPIIPPVEQTMHSAGVYGAIAAMLALRLGTNGPGQVFDVSAQASAFQGTEMLFSSWVYRKEHLRRRGGGYATAFPTGRWQTSTADGSYFYAFGLLPRTQKEWNDLKDWMRRENAIQDLDEPPYERLENLRSANPFDISPTGQHAGDVILDFIASQDGEEAYRQAQAIKMGWSRVFQPHEALGEEQFSFRQFFQRTAWSGRSETYLTQSLPWVIRSEAVLPPGDDIVRPPAVGEHTEAVLADWSTPRSGSGD